MPAETVVVPEGHHIIVVKPDARTRIAYTPSGILLVDYGQTGDWKETHTHLDAALETRAASVLVIMQSALIDALRRSAQLMAFFDDWKRRKSRGISAVWALPLDASSQTDIVRLIGDMGYGVHASAPDGACFLEVHKPDGSITVGMTGDALR
ncbi:MAG: hypothetical protein KA144_12420 [Xanthomonadaceae bacterium]|nr:hypothetical protein [Xanthomonadaceae bacterium]